MAAAASSSSSAVPSRSTSLPTRSHPVPASIEEELTKLKVWVSSPLPMSTASIISVAIEGLVNLHHSVDELLLLPLTRKAIAVHLGGEKYIEELLDGYLKLLDACNTMKDTISSIKDQTRAARSALIRRRRRSSCINNAGYDHVEYSSNYTQSRKNANKCLKELKTLTEMSNSSSSSGLLRKNNVVGVAEISMVVNLLKDVRLVSVLVFRSIFSFLMTAPNSPATKRGSRWSGVSKALGIKGSCSSTAPRSLLEVDSDVDASMAWVEKILSDKDLRVDAVQVAQRRLESLEKSMDGVEVGVESIYRRLIQNRVNILNILSFFN